MLGEWHFRQNFGIKRVLAKMGGDYFFQHFTPLFREAQLVVGNLEGTIAVSSKSTSRPLMVNPIFLEALKFAGVKVLSVANNHILEDEVGGAHRTVSTLEEHGFQVMGKANNPAVIINAGDLSLELIAANILPIHHLRKADAGEGVIFSGRIENIGEAILDMLSESKAHIKIVYLHWGEEYMPYPCPLQVRWARRFIDQGALAVVGTHPHIPQNFEAYNGGFIAYSLGNFISDMPYPRCKRGYAASILINVNGLQKAEIIPYEIREGFQPLPLKEDAKEEFLWELGANSSALKEQADFKKMMEEYTICAKSAEEAMWEWVKKFYWRNFFKYPLKAHWEWFKEGIGIK
jgi:poly-gamma-glutamate synthesis protein (capsule biosynthesis protein)